MLDDHGRDGVRELRGLQRPAPGEARGEIGARERVARRGGVDHAVDPPRRDVADGVAVADVGPRGAVAQDDLARAQRQEAPDRVLGAGRAVEQRLVVTAGEHDAGDGGDPVDRRGRLPR